MQGPNPQAPPCRVGARTLSPVSLERLIPALSRARTLETALEHADRSADFSVVEGLRVPLLAGILDRRGGPQCLLAITATGRESEGVQEALRCVLPAATILDLPAWETLPHERLSPSAETVGRRIRTLRALAAWADAPSGHLVVVASVRAALQPLPTGLTDIEPVVLAAGDRGHELAPTVARLIDLAYSRVDMVTRRGEFAVRGGILDVFPAVAEHPVRVEFFGDEVEQLREFSVADQRSLPTVVDRVELPPTRELLLTESVKQRAREMQHEFPSMQQLLTKIGEGIPVEGMESLAPALVDELVPLTHYLPEDAAIAVLSPERVASRAVNLIETNREFLTAAWHAATAGAEAPIDLDAGDFLTVNGLRSAAGDRSWFTVSPFDADDPDVVRVDAVEPPSFAGVAGGAVDHVVDRVRDGWAMVVVAGGPGLLERAADVLAEQQVAARTVDELPETLEPGVVHLVRGTIEHGFELPELRIGLLGETEFYGRAVGYDSRQPKRLASRRKNVVDPLQLKAGDHVVHATHGIGRFLELVQREVATGGGRNAVKSTREFLLLEYAPSKRGYPGDKLYVPTDQLDLLTRYVGGEAPTLSRMGGSDWAAAKGRARKAVKQIAAELESVMKEQKELEAKINNIDARINAIKKLREEQKGPSAVLEALRERIAMVPGLYLQSVEQSGDQVTIKGNSPDEAAVTQFGRSLEFSGGLFSNLNIETQRQEMVNQAVSATGGGEAPKVEIVNFTIRAGYNSSKGNTPSTAVAANGQTPAPAPGQPAAPQVAKN